MPTAGRGASNSVDRRRAAKQRRDGLKDMHARRDARLAEAERELAARPTTWAYEQACKALRHWRAEAERLGRLAGETPRQMQHE